MRQGVRYYCPEGTPRPSHREDLVGGVALVADQPGPDGRPGGMVYGGLYHRDELGWKPTSAGWWVHFGQAIPQHLLRMDTHPRIARWREVVGAHPEHRWRVPVILTLEANDEPDAEPRWVSALDRVWTGKGWSDDAELTDLQHRLLGLVHGLSIAGADCWNAEMAALVRVVTDLLRLGQRVSEHELVAGAWISEVVVLRAIMAAADVTAPAEAVA